VIPVGRWDDGRSPPRPFTTFAYGHPNEDAIQLLASGTSRERGEPIDVMVGERANKFRETTIDKAICATDWDGTVRVFLYAHGRVVVRRSRQ